MTSTTFKHFLIIPTALLIGACGWSPPAPSSVQPGKGDGDALPPSAIIKLGGRASAIKVADFDGDSYNDIVAVVAREDQTTAVVVAWGSATDAFTSQTVVPMLGKVSDTRDSSSEVVSILDIDGDLQLDILTAQGWLSNKGSRAFEWHPFPDAEAQILQPVATLERNDQLVAVRGTSTGIVETCTFAGDCTSLGGQTVAPEGIRAAIEDLVVGDFDHDGKTDILAGRPPIDAPFLPGSMLWSTLRGWQAPVFIEMMHVVDYQAGDINGDGYPDLVAQQREFITDFPSNTDIWISDPTAPALFRKTQTIYNNDNHTDNAELVDANGDGCLDLLMIGVDEYQVAVRLGIPRTEPGDRCEEFLGPHDSSRASDTNWIQVPAETAIGIQQLAVDGDKPEWVLRPSEHSDEVWLMPVPSNLDELPISGQDSFFDYSDPHAVVDLYVVETPTSDGPVQLYVPASHYGKEVLLQLDTGSAQSFLFMGQNAPPYVPYGDKVTIAGHTYALAGRNFALEIEPTSGKAVVGLLGVDFLRQGVAILDLRCHKLTVTRGATQSLEGWPKARYEEVHGHLIVPVVVDQKAKRLMFDTGAPHMLLLGEAGRLEDERDFVTDAYGYSVEVFRGKSELDLAGESTTVTAERAPRWEHFERIVDMLGGNIHGLLGLSSVGKRSLVFDSTVDFLYLEPDVSRSCF